jgi:hypothetical protein
MWGTVGNLLKVKYFYNFSGVVEQVVAPHSELVVHMVVFETHY